MNALDNQPDLTLSFYPYGILLRKTTAGGEQVEYAIDPEQLARVFTQEITFSTGLLTGDMLYMAEKQQTHLLVTYRKPQLTGIFLDGLIDPLRVPLPGLVLMRTAINGRTDKYQLFAVKQRPRQLSAPLYHVPLPNIYSSGTICTGTVAMPRFIRDSASADWQAILGTSFGNHMVQGRCQSAMDDVRKLLQQLHDRKASRFPNSELRPTGSRLQNFLNI